MALAHDAVSQADAASGTSLTFAHTCTGSDRALVVIVTTFTGAVTVTATYNGVSMTQSQTVGTTTVTKIFYLLNPASGSNNIVLSLSANREIVATASSYTGADQSAIGNSGTNSGSSTNPTITLSSATGELIVGGFATFNTGPYSFNSPATERVENNNGGTFNSIDMGDEAGAASVTFDGTLGSSGGWWMVALALQAAAAPGANPKGVFGMPLEGPLKRVLT